MCVVARTAGGGKSFRIEHDLAGGVESVSTAGTLEPLRKQSGMYAGSLLSAAEGGVIAPTAVVFPHARQHAGRLQWFMPLQPFLEQRCHFVRQAQNDIACVSATCIGSCFQERFEFVIR